MEKDERRVLSIQSHVVSGYVGNKSATFPLQILGFEVDAINSVQFSNHKGYKTCTGHILNADELASLYEGLKSNSLINYTHLLTGFIGCESFLKQVCCVVEDLKKQNPSLIYVCDPVMGDNGRMYVPKELLPVYQKQVLPLADIITPNQYEAEQLTGIAITDLQSARSAMQRLHELGAKIVVISSSNLGTKDSLMALASSKTNGHYTDIKIEMPRLPVNFTGTGDLFASLLLAWLHHHPDCLKTACEKTVSTMQKVLHRTYNHAKALCGPNQEPKVEQLELRLIQSRHDIEQPEITVHAEIL